MSGVHAVALTMLVAMLYVPVQLGGVHVSHGWPPIIEERRMQVRSGAEIPRLPDLSLPATTKQALPSGRELRSSNCAPTQPSVVAVTGESDQMAGVGVVAYWSA